MRDGGAALLVVLTTLASACYGLTIGHEPRALPAGGVRANAGVAVNGHWMAPSPLVGLRVGLGGRTEARFKGSLTSGLEVGLDAEPLESRIVSVFVMPHYRFYPEVQEDDDSGFDERTDHPRRVHALGLPVLLVFHVFDQDVFVGPDLHAGTRDGRGFLGLGGHLGLSLHPVERVSLTPEMGLLTSVAGPRSFANGDREDQQLVLTVGHLIAEFGFSVSFGAKQPTR